MNASETKMTQFLNIVTQLQDIGCVMLRWLWSKLCDLHLHACIYHDMIMYIILQARKL